MTPAHKGGTLSHTTLELPTYRAVVCSSLPISPSASLSVDAQLRAEQELTTREFKQLEDDAFSVMQAFEAAKKSAREIDLKRFFRRVSILEIAISPSHSEASLVHMLDDGAFTPRTPPAATGPPLQGCYQPWNVPAMADFGGLWPINGRSEMTLAENGRNLAEIWPQKA